MVSYEVANKTSNSSNAYCEHEWCTAINTPPGTLLEVKQHENANRLTSLIPLAKTVYTGCNKPRLVSWDTRTRGDKALLRGEIRPLGQCVVLDSLVGVLKSNLTPSTRGHCAKRILRIHRWICELEFIDIAD